VVLEIRERDIWACESDVVDSNFGACCVRSDTFGKVRLFVPACQGRSAMKIGFSISATGEWFSFEKVFMDTHWWKENIQRAKVFFIYCLTQGGSKIKKLHLGFQFFYSEVCLNQPTM